jgi:toxin YoeB
LELAEILEYFTKRNKSTVYSFWLLAQFEEAISRIISYPNIGRVTTDVNAHAVIIEEYILFYEWKSDELHILSVWDNRQNPSKRGF